MNGLIGRLSCRQGKTWNQGKNTSIFTDALGPFPDEPLLSAVDKALHLSCSLYASIHGLAKTSSTVYSSGFLTDRSTSNGSVGKINVSTILQDEMQPMSLFSSRSLPDLLRLEYDQKTTPRFEYYPKLKNEDIDLYQENREVNGHQWFTTKTTPNGMKCYEIWSDGECKKCPSNIFVISPNGETISFERTSKE